MIVELPPRIPDDPANFGKPPGLTSPAFEARENEGFLMELEDRAAEKQGGAWFEQVNR